MGRKVITVTIEADGRDKGKVFQLTEMAAARAERWAARAFLALAKSKLEIPDDVAALGLAGIAQLGFQALAGISFEDAEPLLDEMMACVAVVPDKAHPEVVRRLIDDGGDGDDIEEVATRVKLRMEVWTLHTGFSIPAVRSASDPAPTPQTDA